MPTGLFPDHTKVPKAEVSRNERVIRERYVPHTDCQRIGWELGFRQQKAASAADYDAWLATVCCERGTRRRVDGQKLRRVVIMLRNGNTMKDCGKVVGMTAAALNHWIHKLPPELAA